MNIECLTSESTIELLPKLTSLVQDAIANGASIGFLTPLTEEDASTYWRDVASALKAPYRILLIAKIDQEIIETSARTPRPWAWGGIADGELFRHSIFYILKK